MQVNSSNFTQLGKHLSDSDKSVRDGAFAGLESFLANCESIDCLEMAILTKGLFYCYYMSDKPLIQQELASQMAGLTFKTFDLQLKFLRAMWDTLIREWYNIDGIRLNKYYNLLRQLHYNAFELLSRDWTRVELVMELYETRMLKLNVSGSECAESLVYHTIDNFFDQLNRIENVPFDVLERMVKPFLNLMVSAHNSIVVTRVLDVFLKFGEEDFIVVEDMPLFSSLVFESLEDPLILKRNKAMIIQFCKTWAAQINVEFNPVQEFKMPLVVRGDFDIISESDVVPLGDDVEEEQIPSAKRPLDEEVQISPKKQKIIEVIPDLVALEAKEPIKEASKSKKGKKTVKAPSLIENLITLDPQVTLMNDKQVSKSIVNAEKARKASKKAALDLKKSQKAARRAAREARELLNEGQDVVEEAPEIAAGDDTIDDTIMEESPDTEGWTEVQTPTLIVKKMAKSTKSSPSKNSLPQSITQEPIQKPIIEETIEEPMIIEEESQPDKKSVRWESKLRVKPFFKRKSIGNKTDPIQSAKKFEENLKSVLKVGKAPLKPISKSKKNRKRVKNSL